MISLPPTYAEDTRITELGTAEAFIVMVLRLWVAARLETDNAVLDWQSAFVAAGVEEQGVPAFGCFMDIVASTAVRSVRVRPIRCMLLGRDEARLLQLVSLFQHDRRELAIAALAEWLPPAAVRLADRVGQALAAALGAGHLTVPLRHREAVQYRRLAAAHAMPGFALVH
ncbi:MAG TPA: hypothetical protein VG651_09310 [Stellaceae bacterium]|nr:hypothetical protein [Stellaceae bacterium]